jgi:outer membrane protein assembly factor BamB
VTRLAAPLCLFLLGPTLARGDNWPHWRGPNHDGISQEKGLPAELDPAKNLAWKLALPGMGSSTPAVWGDRLFFTTEAGDDLLLLCVGTDGKELWKQQLGSGRRRVRNDEGNNASSSPSTDGKHVWAFVGPGDLACFDLDGKEVWRFNPQKRYGKFQIQFGMHVTPLLHGDRLYLAFIHSGGANVIALDKATGKDVWNVERPSDGTAECEHSYASPTLWRNGDRAYLVVHGNDYATAHRLEDGKEIWRLGDLNPKARYNRTLRFIASPVATPELIVVPTAKNGPVVGVKPGAEGQVTIGSPHEQWRRPSNTPDVPSPLVHDGLVYLCRENGILICMDAKTGAELYQKPLQRDRYRASPVYADGKVYLTARGGTISVVKAGREFELLAVNKFADEFTASPVVANGRIYLRGFKALYAFDGKTAGAAATDGGLTKSSFIGTVLGPLEGQTANADATKLPAGFTSLFNGRDLTGWAGALDSYEVVDGAIVCKPKRSGHLFTKEEYGDFVVRLEYKVPPGGNNGLAIRYPGKGQPSDVAMSEIQILDDDAPKYAKLDPRQYTGSAYGMVAARRGHQRPAGEWNTMEVTVRGPTIRTVLNGTQILDADLSRVTEFMGGKQHMGKDRASGHFGLCGHGDPVAFRNISIKPLTTESAPLNLVLRSRPATDAGQFEVREKAQQWDTRKSAIIVCDMWDLHHCKRAVDRVKELAPRMNDVLTKARDRGVFIIHAPSDCMPFYDGTPMRRRARAAPAAKDLPKDIAAWCRKIPAEDKVPYPIDQSDGGEDDEPGEHATWVAHLAALGRDPRRPWKRQTDLLTIHDKDAVTDSGVEVWNLLAERGIDNVILVGVHTNMCVLGRPFGLRQLAKNGKNVVLMRDLTDTMYNPARPPQVSHFRGTELIVEYIEKCVCPTVTSDQVLGGRPFRFAGDVQAGK